jgi:hypothetical protein
MILRVSGVEKLVREIQGDEWVNFRWVNGILGSIRKGRLFNKGNYHIFFKNIFRNGHKKFLFDTLVPQKIIFITIIENTL